MGTGGIRPCPNLARFVEDGTTTAAFKKRCPFLYWKKRHEEQGEVVVGSLEKGLTQTAGSASPWLLFKGPGPGLNSPDEDKVHGASGRKQLIVNS